MTRHIVSQQLQLRGRMPGPGYCLETGKVCHCECVHSPQPEAAQISAFHFVVVWASALTASARDCLSCFGHNYALGGQLFAIGHISMFSPSSLQMFAALSSPQFCTRSELYSGAPLQQAEPCFS